MINKIKELDVRETDQRTGLLELCNVANSQITAIHARLKEIEDGDLVTNPHAKKQRASLVPLLKSILKNRLYHHWFNSYLIVLLVARIHAVTWIFWLKYVAKVSAHLQRSRSTS